MPLVPLGFALVGVRERQGRRLCPRSAGDLETEWQSRICEATRYGNGWQAENVKRRSVPDSDRIEIPALGKSLRGPRHGRRDEQIHTRKYLDDFPAEQVRLSKGFGIVWCLHAGRKLN